MAKIILLDELTANKIAAGEVIERPASVVKELVENSIDAGSTQIHIEVMNGGINKIKITDNGFGMDKDDAVTAFQRHATSKLRNADDLFNINTLGFRGEALPSIASVAKVVLITKEESAIEGTRVEIYGGKNLTTNSIGTASGTSIDVTELFYNTPARKKYLKTETTEFGHISDIVTRLAMGNPQISFVLNHNGRQVFRTPGNNKLVDVISTIYGIDIAKKLVLINGENELLSITGVIGKPEVNRANRQQQTFFINGRYIKSKHICYGLEEGFHTLIPTGRYPFAVFNLSINPEMIDVNVHPTKMEVRFSREKDIVKYIIQSVQEALGKQKLIPGYTLDNKTTENTKRENVLTTNKNSSPKYHQDEIFSRNLFTEASNKKSSSFKEDNKASNIFNDKSKVIAETEHSDTQGQIINSSIPVDNLTNTDLYSQQSKSDFIANSIKDIHQDKNNDNFLAEKAIETRSPIIKESADEFQKNDNANSIEKPMKIEDSNNQNDINTLKSKETVKETTIPYIIEKPKEESIDKLPYMKPLAQIDKTYIIAQGFKGMFMIDQHAAHERILYENFLNKDASKESIVQSLLIPITLELTPNETQVLINNIIIFNELGFLLEHFGGNTFLLRAVPQELSSGGEERIFKDLLDICLDELNISKTKLREKVIITMACKGAIKANQILSVSEMEELINQLNKAQTPYTCPHGRPTIIHFSQYELEKKFKRIQ